MPFTSTPLQPKKSDKQIGQRKVTIRCIQDVPKMYTTMSPCGDAWMPNVPVALGVRLIRSGFHEPFGPRPFGLLSLSPFRHIAWTSHPTCQDI